MLRPRFALSTVTAFVLALTLLSPGTPAQAAGTPNSITRPDTDNFGNTSLALDSLGRPVVAYASGLGTLKILHCDDVNCDPGGDSFTAPDANSDTGGGLSLALDSSGNPVVAYQDATTFELRILHCNDPDCAPLGESVNTIGATSTGDDPSLALDSGGNPVVAFGEGNALRILHCNDPDCVAGGDSINTPDPGLGSPNPSLALDSDGYPVVSYLDGTGATALKILHCNDANCADDDDSTTSPDTGAVGQESSLALDVLGYPVVSYWYSANGDLRILHCDDPDCDGVGESISSPDTVGSVGRHTSLVLDANGYPVVSHWGYEPGNGALRLLHCNDANCAGGGEIRKAVDTEGGDLGWYSSIALDSGGNPVVSYGDISLYDLKVLHCVAPDCDPDADGDGCGDSAELQTTTGSEASGGRRDPKNPYDFFDTNGDKVIDLFIDIFGVAFAFGDDADSDPPGEPDGYDASLDRSPALMGEDVWDMHAPDGLIDLFIDIFGVAYQYGHDCT